MLHQIILFIHLALALSLIGLVLVQHGKGADAGAAFGSGASGTVFGSQGSGNFLTRTTTVVALLLAVTSISLTLLANRGPRDQSLSEKILQEEYNVPQLPIDAEPQPTTNIKAPASDLPEAPKN